MSDICPCPNPERNVKVKMLHELCRWFGGQPVPDHVFLACLDVLRPSTAD